jgi:predicted DsbA family dithiol-disulfide isomerase
MLIEVYSDVVCPWCYVGEKRLGRALEARPDLEAEIVWRPFQLRPEMPEHGLPWREFALDKFGGERSMNAAFAHVSSAGAPDGAFFDFDKVATAPNTVDAHRLILFARDFGKERRIADALFRAYFLEGKDLNTLEDLLAVAGSVGLNPEKTRAYLASDEGVAEVLASQEEAARLGISGVPFYVLDGRYGLSGAQPVEVFLAALEEANAARTEA